MPTTPNPPTVPALLSAQGLIQKMAEAARKRCDLGLEFILNGLARILGRAVGERKQHARDAQAVAKSASATETALVEALADGVITPDEQLRLRAEMRGTERRATQLANALALPEVEAQPQEA